MLRKKRVWYSWALLTILLLVFVQADATADYNGDARTDIAFYRPGSSWATVPVLFANGDGTWTDTNKSEPGWANQSGVFAVPGDYNQDGRSDIALYRPNSSWSTVPVLFANGDGTWTGTNKSAPAWANESGVIAVPGDYNQDGRRDIAFHRPGSSWSTVPVLFANGDGTWTATNKSEPGWANQPGVIAVPGDYNFDGRTDIALYRPNSTWTTVPVLFANGDGTWTGTNKSAPDWADQPGVVAVRGDYNLDGRTDIAFHRPGSTWSTVPVLFANGDGTWTGTNKSEPGWANQPGVIAVPGDYNQDGRGDIALYRPNSTWTTVPVLFANGDGTWTGTNKSAPGWANQQDVVAIRGDFNEDGRSDIAFHRPGSSWSTVPVLFANGDGSWNGTNKSAPDWADQPGTIAIVDADPISPFRVFLPIVTAP